MKKLTKVLASVLMISTMAGCGDAYAKPTNGDEVILTIGKDTIKKSEVFNMLNASMAAQTCVEDATKIICSKEVEVTDEMKKSAEESLANYKVMYGASFQQVLKANNLTEEQYLNDYIIPVLQASKLASTYIEENFNNLVDQYVPVKATILSFGTEEDAKKALSELKDGEHTAIEVAREYKSASSPTPQIITIDNKNFDSAALGVVRSISKDDGWTSVASSNGTEFYVIRVDEKDPSAMKEEVIKNFQTIPSIANDSTTYYFKKYGFHVYDKTLYDQLKASKPELLIQDQKEEPKPSASASSKPTESTQPVESEEPTETEAPAETEKPAE